MNHIKMTAVLFVTVEQVLYIKRLEGQLLETDA